MGVVKIKIAIRIAILLLCSPVGKHCNLKTGHMTMAKHTNLITCRLYRWTDYGVMRHNKNNGWTDIESIK